MWISTAILKYKSLGLWFTNTAKNSIPAQLTNTAKDHVAQILESTSPEKDKMSFPTPFRVSYIVGQKKNSLLLDLMATS